jgi:hypothetical protein
LPEDWLPAAEPSHQQQQQQQQQLSFSLQQRPLVSASESFATMRPSALPQLAVPCLAPLLPQPRIASAFVLSPAAQSAQQARRGKRRRSDELKESERWYCPNPHCHQFYRKSSAHSISRHQRSCQHGQQDQHSSSSSSSGSSLSSAAAVSSSSSSPFSSSSSSSASSSPPPPPSPRPTGAEPHLS